MPEAVIFDLDGVLVESAPVVEASWSRWAGERGVEWDALRPVLHGRPGRELVSEFAPDLDAEAEVATITAYEMAEEGALRAIDGARECMAAAPRWAIATSGGRELALGRLRAVGHPIPDVLVSAEVREGLGGAPFEFSDAGRKKLKGFSAPVQAYRARRALDDL